MNKRERATAQSGNKKEPAKKLYDFFCRSVKWVHFERMEATEEQAIKYAKDFDLRYEVVDE